ncbi:hypothetical protein COC69_12735 [Bacillus cereus]|uniref:Uncharacterized protein n=1 Tax=Bacillus cereus TaxID=1396 RepID=A0A9X7CP15_BACCE|nr:hypothetical protein [Bacillus cereus]PGS79160.1 hypothetical protein COC69_12735 [Bacillus cereus]
MVADFPGKGLINSIINTNPKNGWEQQGNDYFYYQHGEKQTGWKHIKDGSLVSKEENGNWYYFEKNGKMHTGWLYSKDGQEVSKETPGGNWYYFSKEKESGFEIGEMVRASDGYLSFKTEIDGKYYSFNAEGKCIDPD